MATTLPLAAKVPAFWMTTEKYHGAVPVLVLELNISVSAGDTQPNGITVLLDEMVVPPPAVTIIVTVVCACTTPPPTAETIIE